MVIVPSTTGVIESPDKSSVRIIEIILNQDPPSFIEPPQEQQDGYLDEK